MSSHFIGLPISAELSNGTVVEGIVHHIDPVTGKLNLAQARFLRHDGSFSDIQPNYILEKDSVKDLILLSTSRQTTFTPNSSTHDHSIHPSNLHHPKNQLPPSHHQPITTSTNSPTPKSDDDQSTNQLANLNLHHHQHKKNPTTKPNHPRRRKREHSHQTHQSQSNHHPRNELDDHQLSSHGPDSGFSAHEDTDGIPTPELSPPITITQVETTSTPKILTSDFSQDFDFQAGLLAFDKAKLWAEIASTDSTDPKDRLIAHNRKKTHEGGGHLDQTTKSTADYSRNRNLAPTEMVLSAQEQVINGSTVSNPWLLSPNPHPNPTDTDPNRRTPYILSNDGYPIYPVTLDRLNHALSSASVEYGPSLIQRVENASRSMTDYIIRLLRKPSGPADKNNSNKTISILVGSHGPKGSCAIRTGALLASKGFKVFLALNSFAHNRKPSPRTKNDAFEFQLRLLGSTGVTVCSDVDDLPSSPTIIIEALAENSITSPKNNHHQKPINKSWVAYTHRASTISIDMPSYLNYDTGEPLVDRAYVPAHEHMICLGALPNGAINGRSIPSEVCLVDLTLGEACWKDSSSNSDSSEDEDDFERQQKQSSHHLNTVAPPPPARWGDKWYTTVKLS